MVLYLLFDSPTEGWRIGYYGDSYLLGDTAGILRARQ